MLLSDLVCLSGDFRSCQVDSINITRPSVNLTPEQGAGGGPILVRGSLQSIGVL